MTPALPLVLFALYAAALDLGAGIGLLGAIALPPGWLLLAAAAVLLAVRAIRGLRGPAPGARRLGAALRAAGGALLLVAVPGSLLLRDARSVVAIEGEPLPPGALPGAGPLRSGALTVAPRGPGFLSKTVALEVRDPGGAVTRIGLFPPAALGGWRASIVRYGYAPRLALRGARGLGFDAFVPLGELAPAPEDATLVAWTPEPNVMMGAGTYPPRLEDLASPEGTGLHVFLRLVEATVGGARRDLGDPDAWRWLADGRPERAVFAVQVFDGREKVLDARVPAGGTATFPGGAVELGPEVRMWAEVLAVRDPWVVAGLLGAALFAAGIAAGAAARVRARRHRAGAST